MIGVIEVVHGRILMRYKVEESTALRRPRFVFSDNGCDTL